MIDLKVVHRVVALAFKYVFGFGERTAVHKRVPALAFNVSEPLRLEFLRGFFLGDGSASGGSVNFYSSPATSSPACTTCSPRSASCLRSTSGRPVTRSNSRDSGHTR
jgi:intein/homing endonuclease